jgi:hypothetical protein
VPNHADYDGDGRADTAVSRPFGGTVVYPGVTAEQAAEVVADPAV